MAVVAGAGVTKDVVAVPGVPAPARAQVDFALVVGVDHYPDFRSLNGAGRDALRFYRWVRSPSGGDVAKAHVRVILSSPAPAAPIQDQIDDGLLALLDRANGLGGARRLYFYFSGHGAIAFGQPDDNVALLLARWSKQRARTALSSREYEVNLRGAGVFEELVVILDCCRSAAEGATGLAPQITFQASCARCITRKFIAYASDPGASAYEEQRAGTWQGVFTRALLTILAQEPGGIPASLLKDRLESAVARAATGQQAHVHNELAAAASFGNGGVLPELLVTFRAGRGPVRLRDHVGGLVDQHDAAAGPWRKPLAVGTYKLEDDTPAKLLFEHGGDKVTHVEF